MSEREKQKGIHEAFEEWSQMVLKSISKRPERKEKFENMSGVPVKRLYTPSDLDSLDYVSELGFPGQYPVFAGRPGTPR